MASQTTLLLPLLRRELVPICLRSWATDVLKTSACAYSHHPTTLVGSSLRRIVHQRPFSAQTIYLNQKRDFSSTLQRRFASDSDSFDPSRIERESDSVDVCIVGGGASSLFLSFIFFFFLSLSVSNSMRADSTPFYVR